MLKERPCKKFFLNYLSLLDFGFLSLRMSLMLLYTSFPLDFFDAFRRVIFVEDWIMVIFFQVLFVVRQTNLQVFKNQVL